jgi:heat shock protein HtpX
LYEQIAANKRKTFVLILGFVILLVAVGAAFDFFLNGGAIGLVIVAAIVIVSSVGSYYNSDKVALAISRAKPADPHEYARLYNLVEGLCIASGLPKPRIYIIEDDAPNAFSTGRNPKHAAVAVTTGLLAKMNRVELEAVLAHELSHIRNYDILVMTLTVTMVGMIALLSDFFLRWSFFSGIRGGRNNNDQNNPIGIVFMIFGFILLIFAPIFAYSLQFAVSRRRE